MLLWWRYLVTILNISSLSVAINRPVYKIILNSKGYAQFLQYDIDVAPLREFTFCVWVRVTSVESDQTIFTYVGTDGERIMRLWLDSGGRQLKISLEYDRVTSSAAVEFSAGAWRDVCVSYQADHGAWALYVDAKLLLCEGFKKLRGFHFSGKGSLIIGYGISEKGFPTGLSGEIYGASMILFSTIERNITLNTNPWNRQKNTQNNFFTSGHMEKNPYIVLGDLQSAEIQAVNPRPINKDYDFFSSDISNPQLEDNMKSIFTQSLHSNKGNNKKGYDISIDENRPPNDKDSKRDYNQVYKHNKFKLSRDLKKEITGSGTQDLPMVLEYETPPPITASTSDYSITNKKKGKSASNNHRDDIMISDVEKPPPPEYDAKVYGQWTSSKFASNVLKYLKNINFNTNKKQKKLMPNFHVEKFSDSYPYPSEFRQTIIQPTINYKKKIHGTERRHVIVRRDNKEHQINLQIINPVESDIIFPLRNVDPDLVVVTNRGETNRELKSISHKNADDNSPYATEGTSYLRNSFQKRKLDSIINTSERHRGSNLMNIIPYLKEYYVTNGPAQTKNTKNYQVSSIDPWDNVYQRIANMADKELHVLDNQSQPGSHKQKQAINGDTIGRALAKEVSNQAKQNSYNIPFLNYKLHPLTPISNNIFGTVLDDAGGKEERNKNNFHKQVKLGNALNEQFITGLDVHQVKNTFLGGDDAIPDINRYRSKSNSTLENIPASLETRVCKNVELYVLEDESISNSKIKSPLNRNVGIEFVVQCYKKCSTKESSPKDNSLILIDWITTPVKLFGGAYAKKTKDLCGFF